MLLDYPGVGQSPLNGSVTTELGPYASQHNDPGEDGVGHGILIQHPRWTQRHIYLALGNS